MGVYADNLFMVDTTMTFLSFIINTGKKIELLQPRITLSSHEETLFVTLYQSI